MLAALGYANLTREESMLEVLPARLVRSDVHVGQLKVIGTGSKATHKRGTCGFAHEEKLVNAEA